MADLQPLCGYSLAHRNNLLDRRAHALARFLRAHAADFAV